MTDKNRSSHPMGTKQTEELIALASLSACKILDMGAGDGETVKLLRSLGYEAVGVDKNPGEGIIKCDYFCLPFADESFDAIISECSFFSSGDEYKAAKEAFRVLRSGGKLLLSDVCFCDISEKEQYYSDLGFRLVDYIDASADWKSFYIQCVWRNSVIDLSCIKDKNKKDCRYYLTVFDKPKQFKLC